MQKCFLATLILLAGCKGSDPKFNVIQKNNVAYVVSAGEKVVTVLDLTTHSISDRYHINTSSDRFPHHIYLSGDRRKLAVALPAYDFSKGHGGLHGITLPGGVKILDADSGDDLLTIDVPFANHNATFSADGKEIWTAAFSHSGRVYVYDQDGKLKNEVILDADPSEIIITEDGKLAAIVSGESTFLQVIDTQTKEIVKRIKVDLGPTNVWPGFDNTVIVSNGLKKSVNFVNLDNFVVEDFIDLAFSPGFLIYNSLLNELWICDGSGGQVHIFHKPSSSWQEKEVLHFSDEDPHMLKFFRGGEEAILITQQSSKAYFIDTRSREVNAEIQVGLKPNGIAIKE